jgi:AcrR family transcriptional regulator
VPRRSSRFGDTTEHLRDTAAGVLVERGARSLTLESLAQHGFASVGSVYERWPSRNALIDDLVSSRFEPLLAELTSDIVAPLERRLTTVMHGPSSHLLGAWLVELLHVARDVPELAHHARVAMGRLAQWCRVHTDTNNDEAADRGAQWWLVANVVGYAQLTLGGALIPDMAATMAVLASSGRIEPARRTRRDVAVGDLPQPSLPPASGLDDVGHRVVGVTRQLIGAAGGDPSIREVLNQTGLAAGSLYRRFDSKRGLLEQVLQHELRSTSYNWVQGLLDAVAGDDPIGALAQVFRQRFDSLHTDPHTRNVILELTAQARTDESLRTTVIGQVEHVAAVRAAFFERFAQAGVLAEGLSPEVCGWLVQCPAAGYRLMVGAGLTPDGDDVEAAVARVFWNVMSP